MDNLFLIKAVELLGEKVFKIEFPCGEEGYFQAESCKPCPDYPQCKDLVDQKRDFDDLISQAKG